MTWADRNRKRIGVLWIAFAVAFGALAFYYYRQSSLFTPEFTFIHRPGGMLLNGMPPDAPFEDFSAKFNSYIRDQNRSNKTTNLASFLGYVLATLTAAVSAVLEFLPREKTSEQEAKTHSDSANSNPKTGIIPKKQRTETGEENPNA